MADPTLVPTVEEIYRAKRDMNDINEFTHSTADTFTDSEGKNRLTLTGVTTEAENAIANTGLFPAPGSFEAGSTVTERNQYVQLVTTVGGDIAGGYTWGGTLPKTVTAGSTPAGTGGQAPNAWTYRSDATVAAGLADGTADIAGSTAGDIAEYHRIFVYNFTSPEVFGAVKVQATGELIDATSAVQQAIDTNIPVLLSGFYLIDPSVGLRVRSGTRIKGINLDSCGFLAMHNVAGSVIKRDFTPGVPNPYVVEPILEDFSIMLNHLQQDTIPANIQVGFDMANISRSKIYRCYAGNYRWGVCATRYPQAANNRQDVRGYGFVYSSLPAMQVDYCGGEVHTNEDCKSWLIKTAIGLDLVEFTGGSSAAYNVKIVRPDIQTCTRGISQESQYNTGCTFLDPLIQDMARGVGDTDPVHAIHIEGYDNKVLGGYFESVDSSHEYYLYLANTARGNNIEFGYMTVANNQHYLDLGTNNTIKGRKLTTKTPYTMVGNVSQQPIGIAVFDATGAVLQGYNVSGIVINGVGDINVNWSTSDITTNSRIEASCYSNPSGDPITCQVYTHSATTTRIISYNLNGGSSVQITAPKYVVTVY